MNISGLLLVVLLTGFYLCAFRGFVVRKCEHCGKKVLLGAGGVEVYDSSQSNFKNV